MEQTDEQSRFDRALLGSLETLAISVSRQQAELMYRHYQLVLEANRQFNLTRITSPEDAAVKHYADSLSLLKMPDLDRESALSVLDLGTGAGFPAVPLAIACPAWQLRAIDGTGKKARFVADSTRQLGLKNLTAVHIRAEAMASESGTTFDLVLLRAVTVIADGLKAATPLIGKAGSVVFYKTSQTTAHELSEGERLARHFKLQPLPPVQVTIAGGTEAYERVLLAFRRST